MCFQLRPHHLVCNFCFQGKGYDQIFIENFRMIHQTLKMRHSKIRIIQGVDDICLKCPERQDDRCKNEAMVINLDRAYLDILQLKYQEIVTAANVANKIKKFLSIQKFHEICAPCSWKASGICEAVLLA